MDNLNVRKVVLLGTSHPIQRGENLPDVFRSMLIHECEKHQIIGIAEEADENQRTIGYKLAAERNYKHLYADPDIKERRKRGIPLPEDIRYYLQNIFVEKYPEIQSWPRDDIGLPEEVQKELDEMTQQSYRMREKVWLENIERSNVWPLLFVCGANHFNEFKKLLSTSGIHVIRSDENRETEEKP